MNALATTTHKPVGVLAAVAGRYQMDPEAFKATVKGTVFPNNGTQEELAAFLVVANEYQLNPLTREIYAFPKRGGGIVPIVSIDGWISLVNSHPSFKGMELEAVTTDKGALTAYTCRIWRKDREMPTVITEYLDECIRSTDPWKMKHRMLRHKALIQCARYAFGFSGIYDEDEGVVIADAEVREVAPQTRRQPPAPTPSKQIEHSNSASSGLDAKPAETKPEPTKVTSGRSAPTPAVETPEAKLARIKAILNGATDQAQLEAVLASDARPIFDTLSEADQKQAIAIYEQVLARLLDAGAEAGPSSDEDAYDPAPILAEIGRLFDDCDSEERLELVREKQAMPLYDKLARSDQEAAKHLYNLAQKRIFDADAAEAGDPVGPDERGHPDDDFPGDKPSSLPPATKKPEQMNAVELEGHIRSYIESATDADVLKKQWLADSELREILDDKTRQALRALWKAHMDELRAAEGQG